MDKSIVILGLVLTVFGTAGAAEANDISSERASDLERLVIQDCGSCHGLTLKGGLGRPITQDLMMHWDRGALRDVILDGIPGTAMPPWRLLLSEAEALWIADFLRGETGDGT
ncbi:c-type cytochrome [Primorskyibacter sp. S187A]|uniref:c-type cytochrome n=1 Tax=Primorskyibacter sp. S187A TaxID=3415130 RepID=UPI003C7E7A4E